MNERPILFSGPMVRAILDGTKTQTRRVVKVGRTLPEGGWDCIRKPGSREAIHLANGVWSWRPYGGAPDQPYPRIWEYCPYGQPGDRLRVKEHAWMWCEKVPSGMTKTGRPKFHYVPSARAQVFYCADHPEKPTGTVVCEYRGYQWGWRKKLGRFLPGWASRITLEITAVRVERLNDISEADAKAEGVEPADTTKAPESVWLAHRVAFSFLWERINGAGSWAANPFVWSITFRRIA